MKYEPLKRRLESTFPPVETHLTFRQIEDVLGFPLPVSARKHQAWWSNTRHGHSHAAAWLDAGWRTAGLDLAGEQVTFMKVENPGLSEGAAVTFDHQESSRDPTMMITGLSPAALLMVDNHVEDHGGDRAAACVALLNELAIDRRKAMLDWFQQATPRLATDSVDLLREGRDER